MVEHEASAGPDFLRGEVCQLGGNQHLAGALRTRAASDLAEQGRVDAFALKLGCDAVLMQLPIGSEADFRGVIDLVTQRAIYFDGANGEDVRVEGIPADLADAAQHADDLVVLAESSRRVASGPNAPRMSRCG